MIALCKAVIKDTKEYNHPSEYHNLTYYANFFHEGYKIVVPPEAEASSNMFDSIQDDLYSPFLSYKPR